VSVPSPEQIPNRTTDFVTKSQRTPPARSSAKETSLRRPTTQTQRVFRSIEFVWAKVKGTAVACEVLRDGGTARGGLRFRSREVGSAVTVGVLDVRGEDVKKSICFQVFWNTGK